MSTALSDQAARDRVGATALDETLFVEAGAGSGKTTLLVTRTVALVLDRGVSLGSIAAITFTEAAAAELASRIRTEFEKELQAAQTSGDSERAERCRHAITEADLAAITTLHGFANRILGEFSILAGLPPAVSVLDEVNSHLAQEQRWERFVNRVHDRQDLHDLLVVAAALDIPLEPRYRDQVTLAALAIEFDQNWDRLDPLVERGDDGGSPGRFDPVTVAEFDGFDAAIDTLEASLADCLDLGDLLAVRVNSMLPEMRAIAELDDPIRKLRLLKDANWTRGSGGRAPAWADGAATVAEVKSLIEAVSAAAADAVGQVSDRALRALAELIALDSLTAARRRRREGGLEFHDLLVLARNLLRTNLDARRAMHERYAHLLLDEFQDTDPIQIEIATLIATDVESVDGLAWNELAIAPGRLFFVGDPKQSIYRFRRADIGLFLGARDAFTTDSAGAEQLTTNFRTVDSIVTWVNSLFSAQMPDEVPAAQPRYQALHAFRADSPDSDHRPVMLGGLHPDPKAKAAEVRAAEADDVAAIVGQILGDPDSWPVGDVGPDGGRVWRPARIDDITILVPTRASLPYLKGALDSGGHSYAIATGTLVYDTQQVVDALAALRSIDDPSDELSLVAALRSPLYACSDVDLFTWRRAGGRWNHNSTLPSGVQADHPVALAFAHLNGLWRERWFLSPSQMLERLLRERRAALLAFGSSRPADVWRRLRFLVEQARAFEEASPGDLRAFCAWAGLRSAPRATVHEPLLPETDNAALSVRTMHGAKGLEFPITILSGMTTEFRNRSSGLSVLWDDDGPPAIKLKANVATLDHRVRAGIEDTMDSYERWRLGYVATTRARDHLIVSCHHSQRGASKCYGGLIHGVFDTDERRELARWVAPSRLEPPEQMSLFPERQAAAESPDAATGPEPEVASPAPVRVESADDRSEWIAERNALLARAGRSRVGSATAIANALAEPDASGRGGDDDEAGSRRDEDDDGSDQPGNAGSATRRRGRTGTAIGSAVHGVLERVDLAASGSAARLESMAVYCAAAESIPHLTRQVQELAGSLLDSDAVALAAANPHYKEVYVAAPAGDQTIEGYVDLLIRTPDGLVVVDYKTDSTNSPAQIQAKVEHYGRQAAAYAVALETSTGLQVIECRLVFARRAGAIEHVVNDLDTVKARVLAQVTAGLDHATQP